MEQTGVKRTAACNPSADEINALPESSAGHARAHSAHHGEAQQR